MKTALFIIALLLTGCASKCPDCLTISPLHLGIALQKAWDKGFDDGEDAADLKRLKAL